MDSNYRSAIRRKLMEDILEKMSDDEKRVFALYSMQEHGHEEVMSALHGISKQIEKGKHSWLADFGANIAGNAVWDGATYLLSRLVKTIK